MSRRRDAIAYPLSRRSSVLRSFVILAAGLGALVLAGWALGELVQHVLAGSGAGGIDHRSFAWWGRQRTSSLTTTARAITHLGGSAVAVPVILGVGGALGWRWRSPTYLLFLLSTFAGVQLLFRTVKVLVERPRPPVELAIGHFPDFAFPSGHAALAMAVWGGVAVVCAHHFKGRAGVAIWAVAASVIVLVGLTRLYLGAHWLTDVLGGWVLAAGWLATATVVIRLPPVDDAMSDSR